jgi:hypothetical protein
METRLPATQLDAVQRCFRRKHADDQFYDLAETLLWKNQAVAALLDEFRGPAEGVNDSQRAFAAVAIVDLEVPNGGLLQFFWNCPGWVDEVPAALRAMELPSLADVFERSTAELITRMERFSEFRKKDSLEAFSDCAGEFDFKEFDSAYFDLGKQVHANAIAFVSQHLPDFIVASE